MNEDNLDGSTFESEIQEEPQIEQMSQGMRFADMRDKLRQAAIERARRDS